MALSRRRRADYFSSITEPLHVCESRALVRLVTDGKSSREKNTQRLLFQRGSARMETLPENHGDSESIATGPLNGSPPAETSAAADSESVFPGRPRAAFDEKRGSSFVERKPTGPRTDAGKKRSKLNAVRHGIYSKVALLPGESRAEFDMLLNGLHYDFEPQGKLETMLVEKLAVLSWRYRRLLIAEAAEIGRKAQRLLRWEREEREERKANEPFDQERQHRGLVDRILNPIVFDHCMRVLDAVRTEVRNHGFDSDQAEQWLRDVYGTDRPVSLFSYYRMIRALAKASPERLDPSTAKEYSQKFAAQVGREMHYFALREHERKLIEADRLRLESVRRNVPDSSQLDRLLRYEANIERAFDRTLTQLERLQRMRLGQPVAPPINVSLSSS